VIELLEVSKSFNVGKLNQFDAVQQVSCRIPRGGVTILKGPSGSGKTTLLTLIGCMARPSSGRIVLNGLGAGALTGLDPDTPLEITSLPERFLTGIRRSAFGFIFQQFNLVRGISVLENIMLPAYPTGEDQTELRARAAELLGLFNITRHSASQVGLLSGGEMQRVAIARALINNPQVVIADEPTAHLDSRLSRDFMEIVAGFKARGKTVLIASHDPIVYDSPLADQVIEMRDGAVIQHGNPA
jgi:putative ABC transport system ATP-binding protein